MTTDIPPWSYYTIYSSLHLHHFEMVPLKRASIILHSCSQLDCHSIPCVDNDLVRSCCLTQTSTTTGPHKYHYKFTALQYARETPATLTYRQYL